MPNLLEKEQNDVDSARVQLEKAQADREAAVAAKAKTWLATLIMVIS